MSSAFSAASTTDEVLEGVDLTGQRFLVTGVSAGLGVETTRALLAHGASVVGTARDLAKADRALAPVREFIQPGASLDVIEVDLASQSSVRRGTDELLARGQQFDVVIANAGVMACPQGTTEDGFETQFGTNHLGHFVFVNRVIPLIKSPGRIVLLSSTTNTLAFRSHSTESAGGTLDGCPSFWFVSLIVREFGISRNIARFDSKTTQGSYEQALWRFSIPEEKEDKQRSGNSCFSEDSDICLDALVHESDARGQQSGDQFVQCRL